MTEITTTPTPTAIAIMSTTATLTAAQVNNGSTDNCSITSVAIDKTNFSGDSWRSWKPNYIL